MNKNVMVFRLQRVRWVNVYEVLFFFLYNACYVVILLILSFTLIPTSLKLLGTINLKLFPLCTLIDFKNSVNLLLINTKLPSIITCKL